MSNLNSNLGQKLEMYTTTTKKEDSNLECLIK